MVEMKQAVAKNLQPQKESVPSPLRVCFVCTGNTCRSPMAAAVANALAESERAQYPDAVKDAISLRLIAVSRGLYAEEGAPISENAILALDAAGVKPCPEQDYRNHVARTVRDEDVQETDLFVAVSARHAMELLLRFPNAAQKIVCMPRSISDPWGGDLNCYAACLQEITECVRELFFHVQKESE